MNAQVASTLGIPRDIKIGSTMTPIATTAPAPKMDEKHAVVTTQSKIQVSAGLSPPSSVVVRIRVDAIPVFIRTRPNHAPKITLTSVAPHPSGPLWKVLVKASIQLILMASLFAAIKSGLVTNVFPIIGSTVQITPITKIPSIRFPPRTAYTTSPKKEINNKIPIKYSIVDLLSPFRFLVS